MSGIEAAELKASGKPSDLGEIKRKKPSDPAGPNGFLMVGVTGFTRAILALALRARRFAFAHFAWQKAFVAFCLNLRRKRLRVCCALIQFRVSSEKY